MKKLIATAMMTLALSANANAADLVNEYFYPTHNVKFNTLKQRLQEQNLYQSPDVVENLIKKSQVSEVDWMAHTFGAITMSDYHHVSPYHIIPSTRREMLNLPGYPTSIRYLKTIILELSKGYDEQDHRLAFDQAFFKANVSGSDGPDSKNQGLVCLVKTMEQKVKLTPKGIMELSDKTSCKLNAQVGTIYSDATYRKMLKDRIAYINTPEGQAKMSAERIQVMKTPGAYWHYIWGAKYPTSKKK